MIDSMLVGKGSRNHAGLTAARRAPEARERTDVRSRACSDHHGRQRPLGQGARPAAAGRPSRRRRGAAQTRARGQRARHRLADCLRLLVRKLVAPEIGSQRPDGAAQAVHPPRPRRASPERRQGAHHRRPHRPAARHQGAARRGRGADRAQPRADAGHRLQLWRPRRDRARRAQAGARQWRPASSPPTRSRRTCLPTISTRQAFPIRTWSSAPAARFGVSNFLPVAGRLQRVRLPAVLLARFQPRPTWSRRSASMRPRERRYGGVPARDVAL